MSRRFTAISVVLAMAVAGSLVFAVAASGNHRSSSRDVVAGLNGFEEVPSISTRGRGSFAARLDGDSIEYRLAYRNLEGTPQQAHIHFARRDVNGGVVAFLCGGGNKPSCPASGAVTGSIAAADILAVPEQGIAAGELSEVLNAIRAQATYANVHTSAFPNGEIRGQIIPTHQLHPNGRDGDKRGKHKDRRDRDDKDDDD